MSSLFEIGIPNFGVWVYHHKTPCCVHSWPSMTLTFDLYVGVGGGGILSEFLLKVFYLPKFLGGKRLNVVTNLF